MEAKLFKIQDFFFFFFLLHRLNPLLVKFCLVLLIFNKEKVNPCNKEYGRLLYVGTIEQRKGIKYLIEALSQIPKELLKVVRLTIVGKAISEDYYNEVKRAIDHYHLMDNVDLKVRVSDKELDALYRTSMIFVFPSLLEGFGMVMIEAMRYGLPVIAFNNSAMPYVVKPYENGILVPNKDTTKFCEAISALLTNKDLYSKLSLGAEASLVSINSFEDFDSKIIRIISEWENNKIN